MEVGRRAAGLRRVHHRHRSRVATVIRRIAQALVAVFALLLIISDIQRVEHEEEMREVYRALEAVES